MNNHYRFAIIAAALIAGLSYTYRSGEEKHTVESLATFAMGTKENPRARLAAEHLMLRNPATGLIPENIRRKELEFARTINQRGAAAVDALTKSQSFSQTWEKRGPTNVGGRTRALAIDVANENRIVAGGVSGGLWLSTDGGATWSKATKNTALHSVTTVVQDTRAGHTDVWYYGTGENAGNSAAEPGAQYLGDGLFKSTDGGATWQQLASTASHTPHSLDSEFDYVWRLAIDPSNTTESELYGAGIGVIARSTDGGETWSTTIGELSNDGSDFTDIAVSATGVVYAAMSRVSLSGENNSTAGGIWRSVDGISWENISPSDFPTNTRRVVLSIATPNGDVVYFLAETPESGTNGHSLWKYTHAPTGGVWENRSANLPHDENIENFSFDSQESYNLVIAVSPNNANNVFIGGTSLYRSTDGFASTGNTAWIGGYSNNDPDFPVTENHWVDQHALVFLPSDPNTLFVGNDGGVYKTANNLADEVAWTGLNDGYETSQFYAIAIDLASGGEPSIIGGLQDRGVWHNGEQSGHAAWEIIRIAGDGSFCAMANGGNPAYFSYQEGTTLRGFFDEKSEELIITRVDPEGGEGYLFTNPFILDPNDSNIMYMLGGDRVWRNHDLSGIPIENNFETTSTNWSVLSNSVAFAALSALSVSTVPANRLYFGTSFGELYRMDNAHTGDPVAVDVTGSNFPSGSYLHSVAVDPQNADNVLVVFTNYETQSLFYTSDGGASWAHVSGNLEENENGEGSGPSTRWASILHVGGSTVYFVGTSTGLYSTSALDGSNTTWIQEGVETIGNVVVAMTVAREIDRTVVVATHGAGVYSTQVDVTSVDNSRVPFQFELSANYPNPFNPGTQISYDLGSAGRVTLTIYDLIGRQIRRLLDRETLPHGSHLTYWDGKDDSGNAVASGTYFYRMQSKEFSQTRKMVLMR